MKKMRAYIMSSKAPSFWEWILLVFLLLIPFTSFFYGDTQSILLYEVDFMGSIIKGGGLQHYYDYVNMMTEHAGTLPNAGGNLATYDFPLFLILGVWGIPLWFFMGSRNLEVNGRFLSKIYGKSIFLFALIICTYIVYLLCREIKLSEDKAKWGAFIFTSSILVFIAVGIAGQTDIIGMIFILLGLRAYIRHENSHFLLFFMIAVPFKQFALFIFVPLLLLKEKKIWKILLSTAFVMILKVGSNAFFGITSVSDAMQVKKSFELDMFNRLTANCLPLVNQNVPVVVVLLVAICLFCYFHKGFMSEEDFYRYSIYIPMITMIALFISFESSVYWYVHMAPYVAIMLVMNSSKIRQTMLIETAAYACLILGTFASRPWAYEIYFCHGMLLERILGNYNNVATPLMLADFCADTKITQYCGTLYAIYVTLIIYFAWINRPSQVSENDNAPIRACSCLRLLVNVIVSYVPLGVFAYNLICRQG